MKLSSKITPEPQQSRARAVVGGVICAGLAGIGCYIVITQKQLEGGLPFIPETWNQIVGRTLIGAGAFLTALLAACAFRQAFKPRKPL
jgi:hypothetical protein